MQQFSIFSSSRQLVIIYQHTTGEKYHYYSPFMNKDTSTEMLGICPKAI